MHQRKVKKLIKSAEGSAGLLHKITESTMWRREVLKKEEEDARLLNRCEAKRKNGQSIGNVMRKYRIGVQMLEKEEEDAKLLERCEAKRKEWSKHWQCNEEIQNMQDRPWRNEELKECEEALPRLKECELEKKGRDCRRRLQEWDVTFSTQKFPWI